MAPEVVVVGAGPAGLLTAIAVRLQGLEVVALDARHPPVEKACGEGIMPDGVAAMDRLGVSLTGLGRPLPGICWRQEGIVARGRFPGSPGLGLRRTVLHAALEARAREVGVELFWGERVQGMEAGAVVTGRGRLAARFVVAADGLHSRMRRWAGLQAPSRRRHRFGVRRHYRLAPWSDEVEVTWGEGVEAYVTPVAEDEVGIAMLWSGPAAGGFDGLLRGFPALERRLRGAEATSRDRGAGPFHQRVRGVVRDNLALVGDAGGYLDAITGEGVGLAAQQAEALAAALATGDLRRYAAAHRRLGRRPGALTALLLSAEARPVLLRRMLGSLAAAPALFDRLLGLHARQEERRFEALGLAAHLMLALIRGR